MWATLVSKVRAWFAVHVIKYVLRYIVDHIEAALERREAQQEQVLKDKYDQAIKDGKDEEIVKATEDRFNS